MIMIDSVYLWVVKLIELCQLGIVTVKKLFAKKEPKVEKRQLIKVKVDLT
jgi:hypothetical protein